MNFIKQWVYWPSINEEFGELANIPTGLVLNAGCGVRRISLPNATKILGLDIEPGENVDVVASLENVPFPDNHFDSIVNIAVLEHCERPWKVIAELNRVLKTGGVLLCVVPFMQPVHLYPGDYYRYTEDGLKFLLEDNNFDIQKTSNTHTVFHILGWFVEDFLKEKSAVWSVLLLPVAKLNYLLSKYSKINVKTAPCVVTIVAKKK
jgi:SAM-dependent methyltransferase